jgi:hypothetical protein
MSQNRAFLKYQPVTTIASQINKLFFSSFLLSHRISGFLQGEKIKLFIAKVSDVFISALFGNFVLSSFNRKTSYQSEFTELKQNITYLL